MIDKAKISPPCLVHSIARVPAVTALCADSGRSRSPTIRGMRSAALRNSAEKGEMTASFRDAVVMRAPRATRTPMRCERVHAPSASCVSRCRRSDRVPWADRRAELNPSRGAGTRGEDHAPSACRPEFYIEKRKAIIGGWSAAGLRLFCSSPQALAAVVTHRRHRRRRRRARPCSPTR
jgi:hypothetical protein